MSRPSGASREWIPDDEVPAHAGWFDQRASSGKSVEIPLEDGHTLVLDPG